ncbi:MAG: hypothetical protein M3O30_14165 [Planctomycetota bacterium]|nr:hypothetical protein [Planctomycetota bacterium]
MLQSTEIEELITVVSGLDRDALVRQFQQYPATFPVDFTPEFLDRQPLDRLRHLFVAVCLQSKRMPQLAAEEAVAVH